MWLWTGLGLLWSVLAFAGWAIAGAEPTGHGEGLAVGLMMTAWVGGVVTSFAIRPRYKRRLGSGGRARVIWPKPTVRSREWSARYALVAYVITFVMAIAVDAVLYFGLGVRLRVGVSVLLVDLILLGALVPLRQRRGLSRQDLGLRAAPVARSVGFVMLALCVYFLVAGLWIALIRPQAGVNTLAEVKDQSSINVVLAVFAVAVSAPVVEEIFFRGLLYRSLRNRLSIVPAVLIAGVLFGLVHITSYPLDTLPVKAAFGVIACLLYERTGSLLPGIALHSFVDATSIDVSLTGNDLIVLACFLLIAVVLFIRQASYRSVAQSQARRAGAPGGRDAAG